MSTHHRLFHVFSIIVIIAMLFSGAVTPPASAQGGDGIERQVNVQTGKVSFLGPEEGQVVSASDALGPGFAARPQDPAMALAKRFGLEFGLRDPGRELSVMKNSHAENGRITARYQQTYQGIPVLGGELIVNTNERGDLYSLNGEISPKLSLSIQPAITSEQAKQTALQSMAKWYQKTPDDFAASEPTLWIYDESLLRPSTRPVELVWRMEVTATDSGMPVRELMLVNAQRGSISLHFNQIDTAWHDESLMHPSDASPLLAFVGATWYVMTTGNDSNSCSTASSPCKTINAAIAKAAAGDTVMIASGIYTGTGTEVVLINKNIVLSAGWNASFTEQTGTSIVGGQIARRGIKILAGRIVFIDHITVRNGKVSDNGAGIWNEGNLSLSNCVIEGNQAYQGGGGIYNTGALTITNSIIRSNTAVGGGGIYSYSSFPITIDHTKITNNRADVLGGGISYDFNASYALADNSSITNSIISGNSASGGGGISMDWGKMTITNSSIVYNVANSVTFGGATMHESGGGIRNGWGFLYLNNSTVSSNVSNADGGGIYSESDGKVYLNNVTVSSTLR